LPIKWSETEGVVWKTELPGQSAATPIVSKGRVFLASLEPESKDLLALCVDRKTGKVLWRKTAVAKRGVVPSTRSRGRENTLAACSPVTDGEIVCFTYGTGDMVAYDFEGEELWRRNLADETGKFVINWAYASSPLFWGDKIYAEVLHRGDSFVFAIDPRTGKNAWKIQRPNEANAESQEAYTTPVPFNNDGRWELLILGADCLTSHDFATGEEYWRWCGMNPNGRGNFRTVSNTLVGEGGMVFVTSPQHNPMHGLRILGDEIEQVWIHRGPTPDSTTPVLYKGLLYAVDGRRGRMVCLEPDNGEVVWMQELETPSFIRASPTAADGKLYVIDAEGTVVVIEAGRTYRELARFEFNSYPSRSTIVVDDNQLLIRTAEHLYCIGGGR